MRRALLLLPLLVLACKGAGASGGDAAATISSSSEPEAAREAKKPQPATGPKLAAIAMMAHIHEKPTKSSKRMGYLRLGAIVARDQAPAGTEGCPGGWYKIHPKGYACVDNESVSLDTQHPLARAAPVRPDVSRPMPYHYGFVRAVAPLYLRIPLTKEQYQSEFALQANLDWFASQEGIDAQKANLGANDVFLPAGAKKSTEMNEAELFGGQTMEDPIPFWLKDGQRQIPNISGFKVPPYAVFANRVRRHTGLALIGAFTAGPEANKRRFAVTTDLRLVPTSKVKPETGSQFHGIEIDAEHQMPFAVVRREGATLYRLNDKGKPEVTSEKVARGTFFKLGPKILRGRSDNVYRDIGGGKLLKTTDGAFVVAPTEMPPAAKAGEKWVDVSIENQSLVMYEGTKPIYMTLISSGADGLKDPKTSTATVRGTFRIRDKHITTTMDSNEKSGQGEKDVSRETKEGPEGKQMRRGHGSFELRDVPWVMYFEQGYALHASYWHDQFGIPRSHGCINLSPIDAHKLFQWSDPPVPDGWHAVSTGAETAPGTTIFIHR